MAEQTKTRVEPRDPAKNKGTGSRVSRRLRKQGLIPGVIYGHKQAVVPVTLTRDDVWRLLKTPGHLADLDVNGTSETVLIRDVQWDHLGKEVLHLDFARVSAEEVIDTEVAFELKGTPAGIAAGGVLEHLVHTLHISCRAGAIPQSLKADVSALSGRRRYPCPRPCVPPDVTVDHDPDMLLAHVVVRAVQEEPKPEAGEAEAEAAVAQPEVIKPERKEKEKES